MIQLSWRKVEEEFLDYFEGEADELSPESKEFLSSVNFVNGDLAITNTGEAYLDSKFIFERGEHQAILRTEVLNLTEIRELCQSFYGQKTQRTNVERWFRSKTSISDPTEVGRILALLNKIDIISYSKRKGTIQFHETDQVEEESQPSYRITRRTPYSNLVRFRKTIRACSGDVLWIDKHFSKKGLEPLAEEVTGEKFESVRVLCGPAHVNIRLRDDFKRFKQEMGKRGIDAGLRVITNQEILRSLHDRWILSSDGPSWNVPPINSIYGNQEAEIHQTEEEIEFEEWWDTAEEILEDWNNIQGHIED